MQRSKQWPLVVMIFTGLQLSACQQKPETAALSDPNPRSAYTGPAIHRVRLTAARAAELGIKTARVREEMISGKACKVIPITAVIHDKDGTAWTFKSPDSLVFVRERISIDSITGDMAVLAEGPPVGAAVVISGAPKLFDDGINENRGEEVESNTQVSGSARKMAGTATMLDDGTIKLVHEAVGASGLTASVVIVYKPQDEEYQKLLDHVGGLKVGETKTVPPGWMNQ